MIDLLQMVLEEASRELDPLLMQWRKKMKDEVLTYLSDCEYMFDGDIDLANDNFTHTSSFSSRRCFS